MQMPLFASANQQSGDDIDLSEIFADYFSEELGDPNQFTNVLAQQQAVANLSLPTGQGIKTAFHSGALPSTRDATVDQQPEAKRRRGAEENLYLPSSGTTSGGEVASNVSVSSSGVGALSGRLGFTAPVEAHNIQQYQQQALLAAAGAASAVNLPIGMGVKVGLTSGNVMQAAVAPMPIPNMHFGMAQNATVAHMQYGVPQGVDKASIEDQMTEERRLRNREHAKRSRVRKKFLLESLQQQVRGLQEENSALRMIVQKHIPHDALQIIDDCCSKSPLFGTEGELEVVPQGKSDKTALLHTDFSLIESLTSGQQNFVLSDPRLPDNPIVFASPGFYKLTGYTRDQVLGRNCRFLQGTGTDPKAIDVIRTAIANGTDATTCFLNYKADGTPFWNQLFVAALRDADNCIVNYVGVQTMVEPNAGASAVEDRVNAAHPRETM